MFINKVLIYGNLTRDPELRALPSGQNVCNFSVATNRVYKDRDGKKVEDTEFHNIVVFGNQASSVSQHLKKGSGAYIEGRLQTRSWEKDGAKQYRTEIVADIVQFGPRSPTHVVEPSAEVENARARVEVKDDINPDDIPF